MKKLSNAGNGIIEMTDREKIDKLVANVEERSRKCSSENKIESAFVAGWLEEALRSIICEGSNIDEQLKFSSL
jgi:hypothetical protein